MDLEHPDITKIRKNGYPETEPELVDYTQAIPWDPIEWIKERQNKNAHCSGR